MASTALTTVKEKEEVGGGLGEGGGLLQAKWGEQLSLVGYSIGRKCRRWEGERVTVQLFHLFQSS